MLRGTFACSEPYLLPQPLDRVPHYPLACLPTPLEFLPRLTQYLGGPQIWLKRDDLTGLATGGNKLRKMEFILGQALAQGADTLVATGSFHSNSSRLAAAAAAKAGLRCVLLVRAAEPQRLQGNLLISQLLGAELVFRADLAEATGEHYDRVRDELLTSLTAQGNRPYWIPTGGAAGQGVLGYCLAMHELMGQTTAFGLRVDYLMTAVGSATTLTGLLLGSRLFGFTGQLIGVPVQPPEKMRQLGMPSMAELARQACDLIGVDVPLGEEDVELISGHATAPAMSPSELEAFHLFPCLEAVLLAPIYTAKVIAALIDAVEQGRFRKDEVVVVVNTGGLPQVFHRPDVEG